MYKRQISNSPYQCTTELHPISEVANLEKKVPLSWMNANHTQMTDEFLAYARPPVSYTHLDVYKRQAWDGQKRRLIDKPSQSRFARQLPRKGELFCI